MQTIQGGTGRRAALWMLFVMLAASVGLGQQSQGTLRGQVADELGGIVIGAVVTATDAAGVERTATTNDEGRYVFTTLAPGLYTVRVVASGFALYENAEVEVTAGRTDPLDIVLSVAIEQEEVTVTAEAPIGTDPEENAGAVILRGEDLDALPDDPDDLSEALQALAGPSLGGEGEAEIYLDGFTGGRLPPKESIREIRINRNPFSAEYDRLGYGRIEIFTKPGTERFRGQTFFSFNDESLNSRSPFAERRADYQSRRYGGNLSGPLVRGRASFFFDFERRETDDNEVVRAVVLDDQLLPVPFVETIVTPGRRTTFSPRLDWQLNATNTLVARYSFETSRREDEGIGGFNLPERAYDVEQTEHNIRLTHTAVLNQSVINETRFQYERDRRRQEGGEPSVTIRVIDAFTGGGSQVGLSFNEQDRLELQNYTSFARGDHAIKAGARLRHLRLRDVSPQNFAGTYTFQSLATYAAGLPSQFSISAGDPEARVTQTDFSPFVQDDWRVRPNLTLSAGLRFETQTNIDGRLDLAPRLAFAWSPDAAAGGRARTVIRGGFGLFYERVRENLTLQAVRADGVSRQQYIVTAPSPLNTSEEAEAARAILAAFPEVPSVADLQSFAIPQTVRRLAADLRAPYTMQAALSVERQLPYNTTFSVSFIGARTLHVLRSRNINAPLFDEDGTLLRDAEGNLVRPFADEGNIFQYESSGRFSQRQLVLNLNNRYSRQFSFSANYIYNRARSDTDGSFSFPVNQYDLAGEYGRSAQDIRHRFFLFGTINAMPWGIRLNPILTLNSGRPFNVTTGVDSNRDTIFNERPAFATDLSRESVRVTEYGAFDLLPLPGQTIIPRNYGTGPSFFAVNLRASKTFGFGDVAASGAGGGGGRRGGGGGGRRGGGFGGGGRGGGGGGEGTERRYNLTLSVSVQNLFNRTNEGTPVGNLSSPLFGQSQTTAGSFGARGGGGAQSAGNRRVELQLRFSF